MIGRFLEIGVSTKQIIDSVSFYEDLGFRQLSTGEVWPHNYAVLSDGTIHIGLHETQLPGPMITFVLPDLAGEINELRSRGMQIEHVRTGDDNFNELIFTGPDGHFVRLLEARTFSPPHFEDEDISHCGAFTEITLPVRDLELSLASWHRLGFDHLQQTDQPHPHACIRGGGIVIGLHQTNNVDRLALSFQALNLSGHLSSLALQGINPAFGAPAGVAMLRGPEGLTLLLHGTE